MAANRPPNGALMEVSDARIVHGVSGGVRTPPPGYTSLSPPRSHPRASPPPPHPPPAPLLPRGGSGGARPAAHGRGGGSSPSRSSPASVRSSPADTRPRRPAALRGSRSLRANDAWSRDGDSHVVTRGGRGGEEEEENEGWEAVTAPETGDR